MPNAKDLMEPENIRVLFIGRSGTRKTSVAASFPKPFYMFDFDGRVGALRGHDIDYDQYPRISGWGKVENKFDELLNQVRKGTLKYRTIHIASITTILDFFLWEAKEFYAAESKGGLRITRPKTNKQVLMSDMPHYKFVHAALDDLLNDYLIPLGMVCNVIVEAHETSRFDEAGDKVGEQLLATPSIAERLPTTFDETWQFKFKRTPNPEEEDDYRVHFRNSDLAKTTFRQLPNSVRFTNKELTFYDDIFKRLLKGEK